MLCYFLVMPKTKIYGKFYIGLYGIVVGAKFLYLLV